MGYPVSQLQPLESLWFSIKLELLNTPLGQPLAAALPACTERSFFFKRATRPAGGPNQFTLLLLVGGRSKQAWISVALKRPPFIPFPAQYPLLQVHASFSVPLVWWPSCSSYGLNPHKHSTKINSWIYNRGCYKVPSLSLREMALWRSNVIMPLHTHLPFDLGVYLWLIGTKANWVLSIWLWNRPGCPIGILLKSDPLCIVYCPFKHTHMYF